MLTLAAAGCSRGAKADEPPPPAEVVAAAARASFTGFGLQLFQRVAGEGSGGKLFLSPLSAGTALSLAYAGASDQTQAEMGRVLGFDSLTAAQANDAVSALRRALKSESVDLRVASSLWANDSVPFTEDYLGVAKGAHGAEVAALPFGDPSTVARINAWASQATNGKIPRVLDRLDPDAILVLLGAVYFKGRWAEEFEKWATTDQPFHLAGGDSVSVPMMRRTGDYGYLEEGGMSAVRLPYRGNRFAMYVFLPDTASGLDAFVAGLDAAAWERWMRGFGVNEVNLALPRFTWKGGFDLVEPLEAMGMERAFDRKAATFGGMLPAGWTATRNVWLTRARQDVFIEVNEEGTEAAAVTTVGTATDTASRLLYFTADRPFFVAIRDDATGALLFLGRVDDPR